MSHTHLLLTSALSLGICAVLAATPAQAQPDVNNAPKGENPPNWNWNPGGRAENRARLDLRRYLPLTPEQQAEARATSIKARLTEAGFTDAALQTAVVNESNTQNVARNDLLVKWQKITQAVRAKVTPETELTTMLKDFREAVAKEKARRQAAAVALEAQFKISEKPALDALLMTLGVTGDEAELVGQLASNSYTRLLDLDRIGGMANGGPIINMLPRLFTLPQTPGKANGGLFDNQENPVVPLPQAILPQLHLFEGQDNAMPNAAPPADAPLPKFF